MSVVLFCSVPTCTSNNGALAVSAIVLVLVLLVLETGIGVRISLLNVIGGRGFANSLALASASSFSRCFLWSSSICFLCREASAATERALDLACAMTFLSVE